MGPNWLLALRCISPDKDALSKDEGELNVGKRLISRAILNS